MAYRPFSDKALHGILRSTARLNIWEGSVRSGKTYSTLYRWIEFVRAAPPGDLLMSAKTLDTLESNIINPIVEIVGEHNACFLRGSRKFTLFNRKCVLRGANDEGAEQKIRGATFAGGYGDELTLWPESYWNMMLSRLSVPGASFFGTTNPDGPGHWLKKNVIDRKDEFNAQAIVDGHTRPHLRVFHFTLDDNPSLDPEYVASLKREYTGLWYRRFILGEWCLAEGAIWDMFDADTHVVDVKGLLAARKAKGGLGRFKHYVVGIDYGTNNPTVFLLIGFDNPKGPFFVCSEYVHDGRKSGRQKTDGEYGADFQRWILRNGVRPYGVFIDPSAASFAAELRKRGVRPQEADNSVLDGIRFVGSQFAGQRLFLDKGCTNLREEIEGYVWDAKAQARGEDKPIKVDDHGCDALRYPLYTCFGKGTPGIVGGLSI